MFALFSGGIGLVFYDHFLRALRWWRVFSPKTLHAHYCHLIPFWTNFFRPFPSLVHWSDPACKIRIYWMNNQCDRSSHLALFAFECGGDFAMSPTDERQAARSTCLRHVIRLQERNIHPFCWLEVGRNASCIYFSLKLIKWIRMIFYVNNLEEK